MVVAICCTCKDYIDTEAPNLVAWLQEHVGHGLMIDNTLEWYESWIAQVGA